MKSQDIVVLLKLISLQEQEREGWPNHPELAGIGESIYAVRSLEGLVKISKSEIGGAIIRSISSGLLIKERGDARLNPNRRNLYNFIVHGLRFVFPARPGAMTRGVPTAFAAPMLSSVLISAGQYFYVWPSADGVEMGQSVEPLFRTVPIAAKLDERLYEYLALIDAVRLGNQREVGVAAERLAQLWFGG